MGLFRLSAGIWAVILGVVTTAATAGEIPGADLAYAPPAFNHQGKRIIPVDFRKMDLKVTFDVTRKESVGKSRIEFFAGQTGYPMLDLVPKPLAVKLNGRDLGDESLPEVAPDSSTKFRYLTSEVREGSTNVLEIEYELAAADVTFTVTGVRVGFFMSDVGEDRAFLESYAPSNFEFDPFALSLRLEVLGGAAKHRLFTNGAATPGAGDTWNVEFPVHFTTSSFYVHLTEQPMEVRTMDYGGIVSTFPVTVYASSASNADQGLAETKTILRELEEDYGPFAHDRLVIYVTSTGGGMEHCGATMTSLWALGHELTHSWFARGYMPASGNAGWMDEAIASWRDDGYPTAGALPNRPPVMLASFSPYRRTTTYDAYTEGAQFISDLDFVFKAQNGMKSFLRNWFAEKKRRVATTPEFQRFLETQSHESLSGLFDRYVYGKGWNAPRLHPLPLAGFPGHIGHSRHPRPFTKAELVSLR